MADASDGLTAGEMKFLLVLCRTQSLTHTAETLGLSVATASRLLISVRKIFKDELFVRSGNGMAPTHRMKTLVPKLETTLQSINSLVSDEVFDPRRIDRTFTLSMNDNAFITLLQPVLAEIHAVNPRLRIRVVAPDNNLIENLREARIDFAFYYEPDHHPLPPDIRHQKLFDSDHVVVVKKDHPLVTELAAGESLTQERLFRYPMVSLRLPNPRGDNTVEVMVREEENPRFKVFVETPFFSTMPFVLMESDAFAVLTRDLAEAYARIMPLTILEDAKDCLPQVRFQWTPSIVWHARSSEDYALQWLRSMIVAHFESRRVRPM